MKKEEILHYTIFGFLIVIIFILLSGPQEEIIQKTTYDQVAYDECFPTGTACVDDFYLITCEYSNDDSVNDAFLDMKKTTCLFGCKNDKCLTKLPEKKPIEEAPIYIPPENIVERQTTLTNLEQEGLGSGISKHPAQVQKILSSIGETGQEYKLGYCEGELLDSVYWEDERSMCKRDRWDNARRGLFSEGECCRIYGDSKTTCTTIGDRLEPQGPGSEFVELNCYSS